MADLEGARKKIDRVLLNWFIDDPILLSTACMLNREPDPKQETMGIDVRTKVPTLRYNPNFVNIISEEKLELVLTTELFKVLLRHCTTRLKEPKQISALSSSITINQLLNSDLHRILNGINDITPDPCKFGLEPNKYFEEYYRKLMSKVDDANEKIKQIWNSMTDEQKKEMIDKMQQNCQDQSQSQNQDNGNDSDGYKDYNDQHDAMKDYYNPKGTSNDGWGTNDIFDAEVKNFIDSKKSSANGWGKHTGNVMGDIIAANEPKISYKEIVRRFNKSVILQTTITSRMKINRRYDIDLPGYRRQYKSRIMFAIDVSGSMGDDDLAEGFAVINNICKHAEIIFVQFDTEIKSIERKFKKAKETFKVHGRGGTDFQQIINLADQEYVDGLVIFTDGMADVPTEPKRAKVLWLMHSKNHKPPVMWPNRSYVAYLERYEDTHTW